MTKNSRARPSPFPPPTPPLLFRNFLIYHVVAPHALPHLPRRRLHTVRVFGFHQREVEHDDNSNEWNTSVLDVDAHTCRSGDANNSSGGGDAGKFIQTQRHHVPFGATRSSGTPTTPAAVAPASSYRPNATMSLFGATRSSGSTAALGDQQESSLPINETNDR